jgi:glycosyltransferase involved in cell wall biosynthesis
VKKVIHLTSVHSRYDTRIFAKQCQSLAANGYSVTLIVADGKGTESKSGVRIVDVGNLTGRRKRMLKTTREIFREAVVAGGDAYHLHDPELIPVGLKLKRLGKRVVFDSHEDVPQQLLGKPYLGPIRLRVLSVILSLFERYACRRLDGIVAATPPIRDKFLAINPNSIDVNNYPLLNERYSEVNWESKKDEICYVGSISSVRGIREMVTALQFTRTVVRLNLVGSFSDRALEAEVKALPGWQHVNEHGYLNRDGVRDVLGRSLGGLVTLHPIVNYLDSLPVKMFEYMIAGIPPIVSDFPLWREIVVKGGCGVCVDPLDPVAIAGAIDDLIADRAQAERMGMNGRKAVLSTYNWPAEERKLLAFYSELTDRAPL